MTTRNDLDINCKIRRVLVRHWIDLGRISIRTNLGRSCIYGSLARIAGHEEDIIAATIGTILTEVRRIREVVHVELRLENWTYDEGNWRPTKAR